MTESKKMPGLLKDPWRSAPPPTPATKYIRPASNKPETTGASVPDDDLRPEVLACIEFKGYGGITVEDVATPAAAVTRLLEFCVDHRAEIEKTFTDFGIVIAQLPVAAMPDIKFYLQRNDGWLLAIPDAVTREMGCFQLIQAMLKLHADSGPKKKLESYKIRPYKV